MSREGLGFMIQPFVGGGFSQVVCFWFYSEHWGNSSKLTTIFQTGWKLPARDGFNDANHVLRLGNQEMPTYLANSFWTFGSLCGWKNSGQLLISINYYFYQCFRKAQLVSQIFEPATGTCMSLLARFATDKLVATAVLTVSYLVLSKWIRIWTWSCR